MSPERPRDGGESSSAIWRQEESRVDVNLREGRSDALWRDDEDRMPSPGVSEGGSQGPWKASDVAAPSTTNGRTTTDIQAPPKKSERTAEKGAPKRGVRRALRWALFLLMVAFVGDATYSFLTIKSSLETAADRLTHARGALADGSVKEASDALDQAQAEAAAAESALKRPSMVAISQLPLIGGDMEVLRTISGAAEDVATTGEEGVAILSELGVSGEGIAESIYSNGSVHLEPLIRVQPRLSDVASDLRAVEKRLLGAPRPLIPPLQVALAEARTEVSGATGSADRGAALFAALPELLGGQGERQYLLAFQAIGEARGTGGVIGLYGILRANDGRVELGRIGPYTDVVPEALSEAVPSPAWFEANYGGQFSLNEWQQANASPNFPVVAEVLLEMFEAGTGERLDGVIAMDPVALGQMMRGTGPLTVPEAGSVTQEDVEDVLLRDVYLEFSDEDQQNRFLAQLVSSFWLKVKEGDFDPAAFASGLSEAVRTRHLATYSRASTTQETMAKIDASGEYAPQDQTNVQMFFNNNYAVNKVDYFLKRSISTDIRLTESGEALVRTEVRLSNDAPDGPPSLLLGPGIKGDAPGLNRMLFSLLAPKGASFQALTIDGEESPLLEYRDDGFPVAWDLLEIPAGEQRTIVVTYRAINAISTDDGIPRFRFSLVPQALRNPDRYEVTIESPPGLALAEGHPDTPGVTRFAERGSLVESRLFDFVLVDKPE